MFNYMVKGVKIMTAKDKKLTPRTDGFAFFYGYYEAMQKAKLSDEERLAFLDAILNYAFTGADPEETSDIVAVMFTLIKPNIDNSIQKRKDGKKGGRKKELPPLEERIEEAERLNKLAKTIG